MPHLPRATYRLQLRSGVGFDEAMALVPYLHRLGISDLYLSPPFTARRGSTHGYDVVDPNQLDPALGGEAAFGRLAEALRRHGMGLLLDIVPNHMGIGSDNPWWWDVLKHGRASRYARFFDIDFDRDPDGKLVLPVLGSALPEVLERGEIEIDAGEEGSEAVLCYFDERFPLAPGEPHEAADPGSLERLLDAQAYRLVFWQEGTERRNYRRFFNIDQLAGLRVEEEEVFEESHRLILDLVGKGLVQGLRIDHIDGLTEPKAYLERLQRRATEVSPDGAPCYIVVEKILIGEEELPDDWPVAGTTGYEFMNEVLGFVVDPRGLAELQCMAVELSGETATYREILRAAKEQVLARLFAGELQVLAGRTAKLLQIEEPAAKSALEALLVAFPVYRTYGGTDAWRPADAEVMSRAFATAMERVDAAGRRTLERLRDRLAGELDDETRTLLWGLQQLSGPLMAKAAEDTAFYRFPRLIALNEVGGEPDADGFDAETLHRQAARRLERWPGTMLGTATHDTKRGEDARMRLAVLSELPEAWSEAVTRWRQLNNELRQSELAAHPKDEYTLYQTLVGVWPLGLDVHAVGQLDELRERVAGWQSKALREGKERSDWNAPDEAYERAAGEFLKGVLDPQRSPEFLGELSRFVERIAPAGVANSLAQLLLKLTAPGVPDIYQGTEFWDHSLVDPDNRRPVDFATRERLLTESPTPAAAMASWGDGRIKHMVLARALALRAKRPGLFAHGAYQPLTVDNAEGVARVLAFARSHDGTTTISVLSYRLGRLLDGADCPLAPPASWGEASVVLPDSLRTQRLSNVLDGDAVTISGGRLPLARLLSKLPVALLITDDST